MVIKDNRRGEVSFDSVEKGSVFSVGDDVYMKIEPTYSDSGNFCDNAVNLQSGDLYYFKDGSLVLLLDCELVIN